MGAPAPGKHGVSSAEHMATRLANPETGKFENYLVRVMNSVKNRKRMSLAPEASEPIVHGLPYSTSVPDGGERLQAMGATGHSHDADTLEQYASQQLRHVEPKLSSNALITTHTGKSSAGRMGDYHQAPGRDHTPAKIRASARQEASLQQKASGRNQFQTRARSLAVASNRSVFPAMYQQPRAVE